MSTMDSGSNPSNERHFELSELDQLGLFLQDTVDLLENRCTTPTRESVHITNMPYGNYKDNQLSFFLQLKGGQLSGVLDLIDPADPSAAMHIERTPEAPSWQSNSGHTLSNNGILRFLDRRWPLGDTNDSLRESTEVEEPLERDVLQCVQDAVAPYAENVTHERMYEYSPQRSDTTSTAPTEILRIQRIDALGSTSIRTTIAIPFIQNGQPTEMRCTVAVDELGSTNIRAHFIDPETNKDVDVKIHSIEATVNRFTTLTGELLDEKLLDENAL